MKSYRKPMLIHLDDELGQAILFHSIADAFEAGAYILDEITQLSVNIFHHVKKNIPASYKYI
jgi:hypothetical protein